jgi:phosphatidylglycerol---prolipoprotein diacylglyceryl transferase
MTTLAAWLHNIDPILIQFTESIAVRWYGLSYIAAFACGYIFTKRIVTAGKSTLTKYDVFDFIITSAIGVVLGGRLGYVLFYRPDLFVEFGEGFPYWGALQVNNGGMSSHGGFLGVAFVVWWFSRKPRVARALSNQPDVKPVKHGFLHLYDLAAFTGAIGFFFGRIANFINAELVGRVCSPDYGWAVKFPKELHQHFINAYIYNKDHPVTPAAREAAVQSLRDMEPAVQQIGVSADAWQTAIQNGDSEVIRGTIDHLVVAIQQGGDKANAIGAVVDPLLLPHYPSQLFAAFLEGLLVFIVLAVVWRKPRKPGVIAGLFGLCYGVMRIIDETWRAPDAHIANAEFAAVGITRGQLLSIFMAVLGAVLVWWSARRNVERVGGWSKIKSA